MITLDPAVKYHTMAINLEQIKKNYADLEDIKIERLAKDEVGSLEPDAIPILIAEIKKRRLDPDLIKEIEVQTQKLTEPELKVLKTKITNLSCPECGQRNTPLTGSLIRTVKSFVVITAYTRTSIISCKQCADKKRKNALISTALLGWWGIPWGIFKTPHVIISSLLDTKKREEQSDAIITQFVIRNIGEIRKNYDQENELIEFIRKSNKPKKFKTKER